MPRSSQHVASQPPQVETGTPPRRLRTNKSLSCHFCNKEFRRLEHVQRHERTHTKEKPFKCYCGKNFARRDLLSRHSRLSHIEGEQQTQSPTPPEATFSDDASPTSDPRGQRKRNPLLIDLDLLQGLPDRDMSDVTEELLGAGVPLASQAPNLRILSEAASNSMELPLNDPEMLHPPAHSPSIPDHTSRSTMRPLSLVSSPLTPDKRDTSMLDEPLFNGQDFLMDEYNDFFDNLDFSAHAIFMPPNAEGYNNNILFSSLPNSEASVNENLGVPQGNRHENRTVNLSNHHSTYSQIVQPQPQSPKLLFSGEKQVHGAGLRLSPDEYNSMRDKIYHFSDILPQNFFMPSRHTLCRYLEGFMTCFDKHIPFTHLPTVCVASWEPELFLAAIAVGAKYMFEPERFESLWMAGRLICLEQIRRRHVSSGSNEYAGRERSESQLASRTPGSLGDYDLGAIPYDQKRIESMQALLILMTVASFGSQKLLKCSLGMQSQVAMLMREDGFQDIDMRVEPENWEDWVRIETQKRTKFLAYCMFILQMVAYNVPPLLLSTEIQIPLPASEKQWKAENEEQWRLIRQSDSTAEPDFQRAFQNLFIKSSEIPNKNVSFLGYSFLIHALLQHIFFLRQTTSSDSKALLPDDIDNLVHALRQWQAGWESMPQSESGDFDPQSPISFSAASLLRLAYVRLHSNLGPCRGLGTRNPKRIALSLKGSPSLCRSSCLNRAVLQSVHALSIPIRTGVNFIARTQTFSWSVQHLLCNLEFAFLLSKWLETVAETLAEQPLTVNENSLIKMVKILLEEAEISTNPHDRAGNSRNEKLEIRQMAYAVIRLWAATFKGAHIFEIGDVIGASLDEYAELLETCQYR